MAKKNTDYMKRYKPDIPSDLIPSSAKNLELIEKKQKQIVEAASKLFYQKGFHGTNIREIAEESGMSMGQLYHYISSKDDILFLVYKHLQELWYDYLVDCGFGEAEDALVRLQRGIRSTIEFPAKNKKLFQFIFSEAKYLGEKHLKVILELDDRNVSGFFKKLLEDVAKEYPIDCDIELTAKYFTFTTLFIGLRGWNLKKWTTEETVDFLVNFLLKGLGIPHKK